MFAWALVLSKPPLVVVLRFEIHNGLELGPGACGVVVRWCPLGSPLGPGARGVVCGPVVIAEVGVVGPRRTWGGGT